MAKKDKNNKQKGTMTKKDKNNKQKGTMTKKDKSPADFNLCKHTWIECGKQVAQKRQK